ncbi:MAG: DUF5687 family protein [Bacteroidota bacterium]|nr:DUF5687 family protein [Bacteroidota bacterium]
MSLYSHLWFSFIRNEQWKRNLAGKIIFAILILQLFFTFLITGLYFDKIIAKSGIDPIEKFNSYLLWYFIIDLYLRSLSQPLPTIDFQPYLRLPVRKKKLITNLLTRSVLNIFNLLPLFILIPFSFKMILPDYGMNRTLIYISSIFLFMIFNNFIAAVIGYSLKTQRTGIILRFCILISIIIICKWGIPLNNLSVTFGKFILTGNPILLDCSLFLCIVLSIRIVGHIISRNFYIDSTKSNYKVNSKFKFFGTNSFKNLGEAGRYLSLELILILRNKRPQQVMFSSFFIMGYLTYQSFIDNNDRPFVLMVTLMTITNMILNSYSLNLFSWESTYFDGIAARKTDFINYLKAKFYLLSIISTTIFTVILILFIIKHKIDFYLYLSALLNIIGVNNFIIMCLGIKNDFRLELNITKKNKAQGFKWSYLFTTFLLLAVPVCTYLIFYFIFNQFIAKLALAIPGIILILSHDWWIRRIIVPRFQNRKYKNLEGYRKLKY